MSELVMDADCAAERAGYYRRICDAWDRSRTGLLDLGLAIIAAKEGLPHGAFTEMINADLPFGPDTARLLMRIARDPRLSNRDNETRLPTSAKALDEIRKLPDAVFDKALADQTIRPEMTVAEARALVRQETPSQAIEREGSEPIDGDGDSEDEGAGVLEPAPDRDVIDVATRRTIINVVEPKDGVIRDYGQLIHALRGRRTDLGMSHLETDERAGFQEGYTGKLEQPNTSYGRRAVYESFDVWLGVMRVGLVLVPLDEKGNPVSR